MRWEDRVNATLAFITVGLAMGCAAGMVVHHALGQPVYRVPLHPCLWAVMGVVGGLAGHSVWLWLRRDRVRRMLTDER